MKGFAILLLCVVAAVQGRSTRINVNEGAVAALGEKPWVVHLRLATSFSGFLDTCAGALIGDTWVLTTAECVEDVRFIWLRYGVVNVIQPSLVYESTNVRIHEDWHPGHDRHNIALVSTTRAVEINDNIAVIALPVANSDVADTANYCAFGEVNRNIPGEVLICWDVTTVDVRQDEIIVEGGEISTSRFDTGAPLVGDDKLIGLFTDPSRHGRDRAEFIRTSAYINWIIGMTGIVPRDSVIVDN